MKGKERGYGFRALARSVESPVEAFLLTRFRPAPKLVLIQSEPFHAVNGGAH